MPDVVAHAAHAVEAVDHEQEGLAAEMRVADQIHERAVGAHRPARRSR